MLESSRLGENTRASGVFVVPGFLVVLVAEATGVGYGLGQVIMLGRNTFNPSLVFFTIVLIGVLGYSCDLLMRLLQRRLLYWAPQGAETLRGL